MANVILVALRKGSNSDLKQADIVISHMPIMLEFWCCAIDKFTVRQNSA